MREIKFRVWSRESGCMLNWEHLLGSGDFDEMLRFANKEDEYYSSLMQFTGQKDKNGAEIYEGDILRCKYSGYAEWNVIVRIGEYEQDGSGGEYMSTRCVGVYAEAINKEQMDEFDCRIVPEYAETTSVLRFDSFEIIGNIHEHAHLLEK